MSAVQVCRVYDAACAELPQAMRCTYCPLRAAPVSPPTAPLVEAPMPPMQLVGYGLIRDGVVINYARYPRRIGAHETEPLYVLADRLQRASPPAPLTQGQRDMITLLSDKNFRMSGGSDFALEIVAALRARPSEDEELLRVALEALKAMQMSAAGMKCGLLICDEAIVKLSARLGLQEKQP